MLDETEEGLGPEALGGIEDRVGSKRSDGVSKGLGIERGGVDLVFGEAEEGAEERGGQTRAVGAGVGAGSLGKEGAEALEDGANAATQRVGRAACRGLDELLERATKLARVQQAVLDKRECQSCPYIVCLEL